MANRLPERLQHFRAQLVVWLAAGSAITVIVFLAADALHLLAFQSTHRLLDLLLVALFVTAGWMAYVRPKWAAHVFVVMVVAALLIMARISMVDAARYEHLFFYGLVVAASYVALGMGPGTFITAIAIGLLLLLAPQIRQVAGMENFIYLLLFVLMTGMLSAMLAAYLQHYFTVLAEEEARLRQQAVTDPLTGLLNRRGFYEKAEALFADYQRNEQPLSMAIMDLDRFKLINDEHGHETGDRAMIHVAERMRQTFRRDSDLLGRLGGDELLVLLPSTSAAEAVRRLRQFAENLRQQPLPADAADIEITLSIGVAELAPGIDHTLSDLMRRADLALYSVKKQVRDDIAIAPVFHRSEARRKLHTYYDDMPRQA